MAGIDMSPEVEVTVKSKEELSCPTDPIPNIIPLPKDCEKTQVDVGTCRQNGEKVKFQTKNKYLLIDLDVNFVFLSVAANHGREFMRHLMLTRFMLTSRLILTLHFMLTSQRILTFFGC